MTSPIFGHAHRAAPAGKYISVTYCFSMRRALNRGVTVSIDRFIIAIHRVGMPATSRS